MSATKKSIPVRVLRVGMWITISLMLSYAVLFSIAGTVALIVGYQKITRPIKQVKSLSTENPVETAYMAQYRIELAKQKLPDTLFNIFVPLDSISQHLKSAVIAAEDDGFYTHPGFDVEAMLAAVEYNRNAGKVKRGASTITQQIAKNLFLSKERSFERKYRELFYTLLMERYLGKDRILELYLNYAQWGKNQFGCEAAAQFYYKKSCKTLTRSEAARMAAVLAMPSKISPHNTKSAFMGKRIAVIANNLYLHGSIDDSGYSNLTGYPHPDAQSDSGLSESNSATDALQPDGWR